MRIMGIDPSISSTGISLPSGQTIAIKPRSAGDLRLSEIGNRITVLLGETSPDLAVVEDLAGTYPGKSARIIPMLHGVIRDRLQLAGVPFVKLNPSTVKIFATGSGSADKDEMALAARRRLGRIYPTNDECDADWCRVAGRMAYGLGELTEYGDDDWLRIPSDQLGFLRRTKGGEKITWPRIGTHMPWPRVALR
jgi:Holliday junction resolvasome RuvABC endonuclease subunit